MENLEELTNLARKVDKILKEELEKEGIIPEMAEARIYDIKTVGVQGDNRTYSYPAEIELRQDGRFYWNTNFLQRLSNRITNEVKNINRIVYVTATKE